MPLDPATVRRIARLARLRLDEAEVARLEGELGGILAWVEQLGRVDVSAVEPMTGAVAQEVSGHRALVRRHERPEDTAAGGGAHAARAEKILDPQRDAGQWPALAPSEPRIRRRRRGERLLGGNGDEGVEARVERLDRGEMGERQLAGGELPPPEPGPGGGDAEIREPHSTTLGTA